MTVQRVRRFSYSTVLLCLLAASPASAEVLQTLTGVTDPLPPGMAWPAWRGDGHGRATAERPQRLVENLDDAKLVWASEAVIARPASSKGMDVLGGYMNFCVWDNRIYQQHFRGSGEALRAGLTIEQHTALIEITTKKDQARKVAIELYGSLEGWARRKAPILADDVLTCIDVRTGKTLWEAVMREQGINYHYVDGLNSFPCTDGQRVYFLGNSARLYAVDARSGELVWQTHLPGTDPDRRRDELLAQHTALHAKYADLDVNGASRDQQFATALREIMAPSAGDESVSKPRLIGRVLVLGERGLTGFDPATGKLLWGPIKEVTRGNPMTWTHQGREYVISALEFARHTKPGICCVDPANGRVLWVDRSIDVGICAPLVVDDLLFANGAQGWGGWGSTPTRPAKPGEQPPALPAGYRLSLDGVVKIWEYPRGDRGRAETMSAVYSNGHVYAKCPGTGDGKGSGGVVACIELATGTIRDRTIWAGLTEHTPIKPWNEMVVGNGRLIYGRSKPEYLCVIDDPSAIRQTTLGKASAPGGDLVMLVQPVLIDGRLFYRGQFQLFCLDLRAR